MGVEGRPVEAVVFDLYGTLLNVTSLEAGVRPLTPEADRFVALWRSKQLEYAFLRTLMGRYEDFWQVTGDALDYTLERYPLVLHSGQRIALMNAWLSLAAYPEVADALRDLSSKRLAVLSNGTQRMIEAALASSGLRDSFEVVASVDGLRGYKPLPAVYELPGRELGLQPAQMLFVSANGFDVAGAGHAGLQVAWLDRAGLPPERLGNFPAYRIKTLAELPALAGL